jgi:hypothetical protein
MRPSLAVRRGGPAAAAVVVLLAACGGYGDSTSASSGDSGAIADSPAVPSKTPASAVVRVGSLPIFQGDFESGTFGQWTQCQNRAYSGPCKEMPPGFYGMQVVSDRARQGQYAARFELRDGDHPAWGGGERAEMARYKEARVQEGDERWYEFSLMFDLAFPSEATEYFMVIQWHGADDAPPPMALQVTREGQLIMTGHGPDAPPVVIGDIARGEWVDYVVHARFSQSSATGWAEVYRNGALTVPRHARVNMNSRFDYFKMGLYRNTEATSTAVLWVDGVRVTAP